MPLPHLTLRRAAALYAFNALVLVAAAMWLPGASAAVADAAGVSHGLVGNLAVALSTSLPEIVVSVGAARLGARDMAAANLFGSNLFNVAILGLDDVLYARGPLLAAANPAHAIPLLAAIVMSAVAIVSISRQPERRTKPYPLSAEAAAMVATYIAAVILLARLA